MDYHSDLTRSTKEGGTGQVGIVMIWCVDTAGWCERTGNTQDDDVLPSGSSVGWQQSGELCPGWGIGQARLGTYPAMPPRPASN